MSIRLTWLVFPALAAICAACAPPGYHYEPGRFMLTADAQPGPAWSGLSPRNSAPAAPDICANTSPQECRDRINLQGACQQYSSMAFTIFSYRSTPLTEEEVAENMAQMAYGPQGQAFRGSVETEDLLRRLVTAAYHGNGRFGITAQAFSRNAYQACMRGQPL
jgi:hypothetical protein